MTELSATEWAIDDLTPDGLPSDGLPSGRVAVAEVMALEESGFAAAERWSSSSWESELGEPSIQVLGARASAAKSGPEGSGRPTLLGVIALRYGGDTADLDRIVVASTVRRRGIGRSLIISALDRAARRGATEMILEVRTDNEPAISLYRSFGFTDVIVRSDYYGPGLDAMLMSRRTAQP